MRPQQLSVFHFIQLCNADAVLVGLGLLRHDVHGDLGEIQICADARRCRNACIVQHIADHGHRQLVGRHSIGVQVIGHVNKDLVDGIDKNVLRGYILEVGRIDPAAVFLVQPHTRRRDNVGNLQRRIAFQGFIIKGSPRKMIPSRLLIPFDCT